MVSRIKATARLGKVISYNEKKVAQGKAIFLHSKNFLQDTRHLTVPEKMERFQRLHDLNQRASVNTLHMTLNFAPEDNLSKQQLTAIADRYMEGLHMEKQPYLVYQHRDAAHPHLHVVTTLIQPDGERIPSHNIGTRLSEPIRKAIEKEFNLTPAAGKKPALQDGQTTTDKISRAVEKVTNEYSFSNLDEYRAALLTFHVSVGAGGEGSKTQKFGGLYYFLTDERGQKISPPVMAAQLPDRPTLAWLAEKFEQGRKNQPDALPTLYSRIDWARLQHPESLQDRVESLRQDNIDVVVHKLSPSNTLQLTYVDHFSKAAVGEEKMGKQHRAEQFLLNTGPQKEPAPQKDQTQSLGKDEPKESTPDLKVKNNSPGILSQLLKSEQGFSPSDPLDQDENLKRRRRPSL